MVDLLLAEDADPNAQRSDGWTALMIAIARSDAKTVGALLAGHADVALEARDGQTARSLAAASRNAGIQRLLNDKARKSP